MKKIKLLPFAALLTFLMLLITTEIFAQSKFFKTINPGQLPAARQAINQIKTKGIFNLDEKGLREYLLNAPLEFKNNGKTIPLEIPLPDGKTEIFNMVESPILSQQVSADHPEIKTYTGYGTRDKKSVIRLSLTSSGFNAIILNVGGDAVYFEQYSRSRPDVYFNYFTKDALAPKASSIIGGAHNGGTDYIDNPHYKQPAPKTSLFNKVTDLPLNGVGTGSSLTTFRLAMPADAEFVATNGGTVTSGFNAVVAYVNRIVAFYRNELSVSFVLVSGTNMIYTDAATDPYDNNDQVAMLGQNQTACDAVIGNANYDIGHVWGHAGSSGAVLLIDLQCVIIVTKQEVYQVRVT